MSAIPAELLQQIANPSGGSNVLEMFMKGSQQGLQNEQAGWQRNSHNALLSSGKKAAAGNYQGAAADAYSVGEHQLGQGYTTMAAQMQRDAQMQKSLYPEQVQGPRQPGATQPTQQAGGAALSPQIIAQARQAYQFGGVEAAQKVLLSGGNLTDDQREYVAAMADPNFRQYLIDMKRAGRPIDVGQIPPGMRLVEGPEGYSYEYIPGSPEQKKAVAQTESQRREKTSQNIVVQDIDRAVNIVTKFPDRTTGIGGSLFQNMPGSYARDVRGLVDTIKANSAFDKLQSMRNSSPSGAALGPVSDKEGALLAAAIGNLEQSQSAPQFADNLRRVKNVYLDIIHGEGNGPPRETLSFEQNDTSGGPQPGTVEEGYRFNGGDPADRNNWTSVQ